jgi:hypothetical protein
VYREEVLETLNRRHNSRDLPRISMHYKSTMYKELKWKFRPWVCLMELDKVATVSFHGYEVIRRIEFNGEGLKFVL